MALIKHRNKELKNMNLPTPPVVQTPELEQKLVELELDPIMAFHNSNKDSVRVQASN